MSELLHFPTPEERYERKERRISDGLDFYKLTMGQIALERHAAETVTFTMKNRAGDFPLSQYVTPEALQERLTAIQEQGFTPEEIAYFAGLKAQDGSARFDEPYLDFLANLDLTDVSVEIDPDTKDLSIHTKGQWANVSLWETVVMSETNELYYENYLKENNLNKEDVWAEGDRRLDEKIERIKNSTIKFADFGTRRRFSAEWHEHVVGRLKDELPDNFIGTSNPWFAYKYDLTPIGTYAHEMPMVYSALADARGDNPLDGHREMLNDWDDRYKGDLSSALTDTFKSDFFFTDFTPDLAEKWRGVRHDSGDPFAFGDKVIEFYKKNGIDPADKTIIFSDGLDLDKIFELHEYFEGKINVVFGWGTTLMNDLGVRANNFVMKATEVNETPTVKLSDVEGKHTGPPEYVERYDELADARIEVARAYEAAQAA